MSEEENIREALENKFSFLQGKVTCKRARRLFVDVPLENFQEAFDYLVKDMEFTYLAAITGLDEVASFAVLYHLCKERRIILTLRVHLNRENPAVKTVTGYFPSAEAYEREITDLLGIKVEGLPAGHRYPLPDNWPPDEYPLRKDWKGQAATEMQEGEHA